MTSLVLESALRATLIIASVAVVLKALRVESPAMRHSLWTGVLILMLLLPALVAWGPNAPLPVLPTETAGRATSAFSAGTTNQIVAAAPFALWAWQTIAPAAYLVGLITLLFRLALSMSEVRSLRREARPIGGRLTHERCASPIVVGYVRPMVILPRGWSAWTQEQLDAVILHEGEHIRRRDPLVQWVALLNRAVFWFHPLAWWLERHVSALAEDACDDAVLARGHDVQEYCEHLITLARAASQAGARIQATAVAMAGAQLPRRIHRLLQRINAPQISRMRLACAAAAFVVIGVVCGSGTLTHAEGRLKPLGTLVALPNQSDGRRSAFASDGGAGVGLRLNIDDFCCPDYLALMVERIRSNWRPQAGADGAGLVVFTIRRDGSIVNVRMERSSGNRIVDGEAVRAVRQTTQLPDLPGVFSKPTLTVHLNFQATAPVKPPALIADGAVSQVSAAGQDKGLTLPRPIREVKPEYTALAKEMRIQGTVLMKVVVLVSGDVGDIEVIRSLDTQYGLDDRAIEAVRQWKFEPGRRDGKVVPVQVTIEMSFTLR